MRGKKGDEPRINTQPISSHGSLCSPTMLLCRHWLVSLITVWRLTDTIQAICRLGYLRTDGPDGRQEERLAVSWQRADEKQPSENFDKNSALINHQSLQSFHLSTYLICNGLINYCEKYPPLFSLRGFLLLTTTGWDKCLIHMHEDFVVTVIAIYVPNKHWWFSLISKSARFYLRNCCFYSKIHRGVLLHRKKSIKEILNRFYNSQIPNTYWNDGIPLLFLHTQM